MNDTEKVAPTATETAPDSEQGETTPVRRRRRTRSTAVKPAATTPAAPAPAKTTPAKTTPAKTTPAKTTPAKTTPAKTTPTAPTRTRGSATPKRSKPPSTRSKSSGPPATVQQKRRRIYRQDPIATEPGAATPPPPPASPAAAVAAKKLNHDDKITLILHPAPKAADSKEKAKPDRPSTAKEAMQRNAARRKKSQPTAKVAPTNKGASVKLEAAWLKADVATAAEAIGAVGAAGAATLIDAWRDAGNAGAIAAVAVQQGAPGKSHKLAKRALSVLKARGIDIPVIETPHAASEPTVEPLVASFVPPDSNGMTFFSISQRQPGGRYRVADVITRDPIGITHASSGQIPGKQIRNWRNRVKERFGTDPIEVSVSWARHCVAEARKQHETSKAILPLGLDSCASLFEPVPEEVPPHPLADLDERVDETLITTACEASAELHADPEFRTWVPAKEAMDELLAKLGERVGADKADDKEAVNEALRVEVVEATDRFFTPDLRQLIARRMRGSAISVRSRSGDERAIQVLAVAQAVRDAGLITSPPSEIPFLLSFFQKGIAIMVQQGQLRVPVAE
jgi:hypothetical protein